MKSKKDKRKRKEGELDQEAKGQDKAASKGSKDEVNKEKVKSKKKYNGSEGEACPTTKRQPDDGESGKASKEEGEVSVKHKKHSKEVNAKEGGGET